MEEQNLLTQAGSAEALKAEQDEESRSNLVKAGLGVGVGAHLLKKYGQADSTLANFYQNTLGTDFLRRQLETSSTWTTSGATKFSSQSIMKSMLSQLMAIEEASPLHVLRTLQLSNIMNPFIDITQAEQEIKFSARKLRGQRAYYEGLISFANKEMEEKARKALVKEALDAGMVYKGGKLYGMDSDGNIDQSKVFAKEARLAISSVRQGDIYSPNQMVNNFAKSLGVNFDLDTAKHDPLTVIAGSSRTQLVSKWGEGWLRYANEMGMKSLDNPLAGVEEMLKSVGVDQTSFFNSKAWAFAKKHANVNLGTNGNYDLGLAESLKKSGKNVAVKSTIGLLGYEVADSALRTISGTNGLFSEGIYTGITNLYAGARVKFAEVWSDRFQGYKESQESYAKGSTDLMTLAALPASGALIGAQWAYAKRMTKTLVENSDEAAKIYNVATESPFLSKLGMDSKMKPMKKGALVGALVGSALALPFLPGALIGESSEELKSLYSGEKEVAQKANRWWLFGGSRWDGSQTQYFTKHNVAQVNADANDKVRYGDDDFKKKLNPFLHPLAYIKDPYRFEKRNAESMPYPVWGMDVNYGSIYGKVFERTVGQIIKPDIVNPAMRDFAADVASSESAKLGLIKAAANVVLGRNGHTEGEQVSGGTPDEQALQYASDSSAMLREGGMQSASGLGQSVVDTLLGTPERFGGSYQSPMGVTRRDGQMIQDGTMLAPASARYNPNLEAAGLTYQSATDLIGLKGWVGSMPLSKFGVDPANLPKQLARSGEATSSARDLVDANVGDMLGFGEFQRKILGTSSGSLPDRDNPLYNNMTSWLPNSDTQYYINFQRGNPYSHIKNGEARLPGVGFAALNPEVEGVDPDDYSLAYRYKVLADVAKGSREHIRARQEMLQAHTAGKLSKRETEILEQTMDQEVARDTRKEFYEPKQFSDKVASGPLGYIQSSLWNGLSTLESPTEMLTPIRPMAKFMHNRTAIEDYVQTQLGGSDAAIWTNPYSHFIKPALNKSRLMADGNFKAQEVREKENINEYFDKLGHLRNRRNGFGMQDYNSVIASSMSGLNTNDKVMQFKKSLSDEEKDYFESFSKETDEKKRDKIRAILPGDVRRGYEQIWRNVDTAARARANGTSVQKAIAEDVASQTKKMQDAFNVGLSKQEHQQVVGRVKEGKDKYANMGFSVKDRIRYEANDSIRLKMADMEAATFLEQKTGVPDNKFMGWDPRLKTDDIKIRTLSVGKEDLKRFGFWSSDEERMNRLPGLKGDDQVVSNIDRIKADMRSSHHLRNQIEMTMFNNNFKARNINVVSANYGSINIKEDR